MLAIRARSACFSKQLSQPIHHVNPVCTRLVNFGGSPLYFFSFWTRWLLGSAPPFPCHFSTMRRPRQAPPSLGSASDATVVPIAQPHHMRDIASARTGSYLVHCPLCGRVKCLVMATQKHGTGLPLALESCWRHIRPRQNPSLVAAALFKNAM